MSGADLTRRPAYLDMQPGDPWTFLALTDEQLAHARELGVGGRTSRWFATNEPGRLFEITAIHTRAVETRYLGFERAPGSMEVAE